RVRVGASTGTAVGGPGTSTDEVLAAADARMYDAKRAARASRAARV
ncbi:hypothetical protein GTQ99_20075, partial [Kineococcus sp. T13]|nr:hypothetical protein [Kineococcus vitellinus]